MLKLTKLSKKRYDVFLADTGACLGDFSTEMDGVFHWYPNQFKANTAFSAELLTALGSKLAEVNEEWAKHKKHSS